MTATDHPTFRPPWTSVAAGGVAPADRPIRRHRVLAQVIAVGVLVIVAVGIARGDRLPHACGGGGGH